MKIVFYKAVVDIPGGPRTSWDDVVLRKDSRTTAFAKLDKLAHGDIDTLYLHQGMLVGWHHPKLRDFTGCKVEFLPGFTKAEQLQGAGRVTRF